MQPVCLQQSGADCKTSIRFQTPFLQSEISVDSQCKNNRILTLNLTDFQLDQEKANRRAQIELYRRRKVTTKVTVTGWGLTDEQIKAFGDTHEKELFFNPNFLIPVYLPYAGLDAKMMISEVEYRADQQMFDCTVSLVNPEVYMGKEGTVYKAAKTKNPRRGKEPSILEQIRDRHGIQSIPVKKSIFEREAGEE